jgi:acyl carrier protein
MSTTNVTWAVERGTVTLEEKVKEMILKKFNDFPRDQPAPELRLESSLKDIGIDYMDMFELGEAFERYFGFKAEPDGGWDTFNTPNEIIAFIQKHVRS